LEIEVEERARLPGYREEAVVRHFDAPEAVETRFYEVRAKSILNRVPEASQMPFRWTINPYRGCSHACNYCMSGDTRVLMADGRTKALGDVQVGDRIYGTSCAGVHRAFEATTVLDKWSSLERAYAVSLEDGNELIASDRHRFLTERGWKHVSGSRRGRLRRPHLTPGIKLLGPGGAAGAPNDDADYRRGYLCGLIRGDGYLYRYIRTRRDGRTYVEHRFNLALTDSEALARAQRYLEDFGVAVRAGIHRQAVGNYRKVEAIRTGAGVSFERIETLILWPASPSMSWRKGFLGGIFDAEGSWSHSHLWISNGDPTILDWIVACLDRLGFDSSLIDQRHTSTRGGAHVTVLGGMPEHMRFLLSTDPAITRKRSIESRRVWTTAQLQVRSIRPLGLVMRMYDITTGTGDFIANGVVSHNCFARPTHKYLDFNAGRDFEREIVVKVNAPELLRAELARPKWTHEHVALGTNTDPYQWVEGRYKLMPGIWEAMRDAANPCSVLTKSPLLLRDLSLMKEIAERTEFSAALSVPTLDERAWRATEPHSPNPRARLEAVAELTHAGIRTGVLVAPLMPGINDAPEQVAKILEFASEAGAAYVTGIALHLRGDVRGLFFEWLRSHRPDLVDRYKRLYQRGAYAHPDERRRLSELVKGPDLAPGERMRGRYRSPATDQEAANSARTGPAWPPDQGRLF
jgi:DNA repair photolyase